MLDDQTPLRLGLPMLLPVGTMPLPAYNEATNEQLKRFREKAEYLASNMAGFTGLATMLTGSGLEFYALIAPLTPAIDVSNDAPKNLRKK